MINTNLYIQELINRQEPSMRYRSGQDFSSWQKEAREKLWSLLGLDACIGGATDNLEIEFEKDEDAFHETRFLFETEPGLQVPCHLLVPLKKKEGRPLMICLQGHSTGMNISLGRAAFPEDKAFIESCYDRVFALQAVDNGYAAVVMDQRYMGERGQMEEDGKPACVKGYNLPDLLLGRCAAGERVWDVMRLADVLEANYPALVRDGIGCMGTSGGGTTTVYAAAIDTRITFANPSAALCTFRDSISAIRHCSCNYIPSIARFFDMGDIGGLVAPRMMIQSNGKDDPIFPLAGASETAGIISSLYREAGAPENFRFYVGNGPHRPYTAEVYRIIEDMLEK